MSTPTNGCLGKFAAESQALEPGPRCCATQGVAVLSDLALFIIGCIGAAGILPGSTMGWLAIGLGGGTFMLHLASGKLKERKITLLIAAVMSLFPIVLGSLGVAGVLSGLQVGWGVIGVPLTLFGVGLPIGCCVGCSIGAKMD